MSLRKAVEKIMERMRAHMDEKMDLYADMLETALEASEGEDQRQLLTTKEQGFQLDPQVKDNLEKDRLRRAQRDGEFLDQGEQAMLCVGGPADGDHFPMPGSMPEGTGKCEIAGGVYVRQGMELHYSEEETEKLKKQRGK